MVPNGRECNDGWRRAQPDATRGGALAHDEFSLILVNPKSIMPG
jgi:hypothetical protein